MTIVNKANLSIILGVSEETLTRWQNAGLPIAHRAERGLSHQYDTAQVIAWMIQRKVKKVEDETQKDRLTRLQGNKIEIEIEEKLSNLVPVDEVKPFWDAMVASAKDFLDQQPERLAQLMEVTEGMEARRNLLADEFDEILMRLSQYEPAE